MILYAGFGAFVGSVLVIVKDSIKIYKSALDVEKIVKEIPAEKIEEISDHNLRVNQKIDISNMIEKGKKSRKSAVLLTVFIIILYLYIIFFITTPMKLYNKFDQDMVKIAPYVDECMITQFKSDWVCMRSKEDYNAIYTLVDNILKENSLPD